MCSKYTIVVILIVLVAHAVVDGKKPPDAGVANVDCPLDDDPFNPTHLPYLGDCTKFQKCSYGKSYVLSCPRGLEWSILLDRCEAPDVANCDPNVTTPKPVIGGTGCSFDYKPHADCDKAIQCADGKESILYCLPNTYWDQEKKKCSADASSC